MVQVYLWNEFLKVEMLGQRMPAFIILINVAQLLFTEVMPVNTDPPWGQPVPHPLG